MRPAVWDVADGRVTADRVRSWVGRILRYDGHWSDVKVPVETVREGETLEGFIEAARRMVTASRDDHHIYIENIVETPDGVFLDIQTGS